MVKVECCDLCYTGKGEIREAVGHYSPDGVQVIHICEECKKLVEKEFPVFPER